MAALLRKFSVVCSLFALACGGSTEPGGPGTPVNLSGTYDLARVDGHVLPDTAAASHRCWSDHTQELYGPLVVTSGNVRFSGNTLNLFVGKSQACLVSTGYVSLDIRTSLNTTYTLDGLHLLSDNRVVIKSGRVSTDLDSLFISLVENQSYSGPAELVYALTFLRRP